MLARVLASFFATIVSNGLARYGYVVLIPILILEQKLSEKESIALALAVLLGYIFGSYFVAFLKKFLSMESIAQLAFFLTSFSFFACAMDFIGFLWLFIWRFIAGFACSALIILSMPLVLPYIKNKYKESISGFIFAGVGVGVLLAGFTLPFLAHINVNLAWLSMGGLSFILFLFSLFAFREKTEFKKDEKGTKLDFSFFFILLLVSYILNSIGFLPHSIFWADYMARELNFNTILAGSSYSFFGFGCLFGSLLGGIFAQKFGVKAVHVVILLLKSYACFLAISTTNIYLLNFSVFLMGFGTMSNVMLTNLMAFDIVKKSLFINSISFLTFCFGFFQALFSFVFYFLSSYLQSYVFIFLISAILLFISAILLLPIKKIR